MSKSPTNGQSNGLESNPVPWTTRIGPWQARLIAKRLTQTMRERLGIELGPKPAIRKPTPSANFQGQTLSWRLCDNTVATHLEVELHRQPCNEIGTRTLAELELLATLVGMVQQVLVR